MPDDHSAHPPIKLPEMLQEELDACTSTTPTAPDLAQPEEQRLRAVFARIQTAQPERSALCISGGGIRSATFALGAVQALAKAGLLSKFDFLSTVSGGGYLGSLLSAWIREHADGLAGVEKELGQSSRADPLQPEPPPLRHIRQFSNYLAPKLGLFSADGWSLVATALRNLLLNWTVLVTLLAALLLIPWFGLLAVFATPAPWVLHAELLAAFLCVATATAYPGLDLPTFDNFRWGPRRFVFGWLLPLIATFLLFGAWWAGTTNTYPKALAEMQSADGFWRIVLFLSTASAVGIIVPAFWILRRDREHRQRAGKPVKILRVAVNAVGCLLVIGCPASLLLWWLAAHSFSRPAEMAVPFLTFGPPAMLVGFFCMNSLFVGVTSRVVEDDDREWWARAMGWVGGFTVVWLLVHGLVFWVPIYVPVISVKLQASIAASGGLLGFIAAKFAASSQTPAFLRSNPEARRTLILGAVALLFFGVLSWLLSVLAVGNFTDTIADQNTGLLRLGSDQAWVGRPAIDRLSMTVLYPELYRAFALRLCWVLGSLLAVCLVMGVFVNANRFSLHATYRNRLVRAYLGAARSGRRKEHPFTGFDPLDNFEMHELKPGKLLHVINIALNLVGGSELAWQERKADSFTVSRLHSGSRRLGYRPSARYADGISIGTALAVSGAAANPNAGYNSSPLLTFLMTLFNVRLGWWLGNPGPAGRRSWQQRGPFHAIGPLLVEACGLTNERSAFVELSDGGHFENLALYEMVLRRCRRIVILDAEQDPAYAFEGLGNAIRKIRIDMGIPIEFEHLDAVSKNAAADQRRGFALGRIRYSAADPDAPDGLLLYIKPLLTGGEPIDVCNYAKTHEFFPHEPTNDQFFSESQFESYRALGFHQLAEYLRTRPQPPASVGALFP